jgi:ABC-type transport system substrate-binding protein
MLDPVLGTSNGARGRALRRAMSLAFDEAWARQKLYNDRVESIQGLLVPEFPEFDPGFVNPWKQGANETYEQALERARKILADAGYPDGKGVPPLYAEVTDSTTDDQFHAAFKRDMKRIGLDIRSNRVTFGQMLDRVDKGQAQLWGLAWSADYPDAQNFFQLFYGPNKAPGPNGSSYQNPEFDRLYEQSLSLFPGPERTEIYRRMQQILVEDCVWIFKYRRINFDLTQPWLSNFKRNAISDKFGKYLRVDPALRAREVERINRPVIWPVWAFVGLVAVLVGWTLVGARRRVRAW